jgi:ribose transport system permease protein
MGDAGEFTSVNQMYSNIGSASVLFVPVPVWVFAALAAGFSVLLNRTRYGRYVRAVGSNQRVALYSAIDVDSVRLRTYLITGLVVGVSALLISMRFNAVGSSTLGINYELDAIAAVIIGGTAMAGGSGTIWGTVIGAVILGVINNMLNLVGVSPYLQGTVKGLVIICAVLIQRRKS